MVKLLSTLSAGLALTLSPAFAQESGEPVAIPNVSDDLWPVMIKLAVAVVVIVAMIYVTMLLLRKISLGRGGLMGTKSSLELLERSYFAPKKFVCLMRVGKKVLLIGVSDNAINLVADVSDQTFPALEKRKAKEKITGFKEHFQHARSHFTTLISKV